MNQEKWIPEIMYEDGIGEEVSHIPFIMVPQEESMPVLLYIFESQETGEVEPGMEGEDVPVVQWDLHQYADMSVLKENVSLEVYDMIRNALGLESLQDATHKGRQITRNIKEKF